MPGHREGHDGQSVLSHPIVPTLATLTAAIDALQTAETAALARTKGAVVTRNEKRLALVQLLQQLEGYIQAQADANLENGASIIAERRGRGEEDGGAPAARLRREAGGVTGTAKLVAASAAHRASYEWEYSTDGGKTWVTAPATLQAKTTVTGLTAGTTVQFRYRPVTKTGEGNWTQPVSLVVK